MTTHVEVVFEMHRDRGSTPRISSELNMNQDQRDEAMRLTLEHVRRVGILMNQCIANLMHRVVVHDASKFDVQEFDSVAEATKNLHSLTFGSKEHTDQLAMLDKWISIHYSKNSHHPQYYENGIDGMDLLDLVEMLSDWKAATERHHDGNLDKSFNINRGKFNISPQLESILRNTAIRMGWL